jgi:hypothetical protein
MAFHAAYSAFHSSLVAQYIAAALLQLWYLAGASLALAMIRLVASETFMGESLG